MMKGSQIVGKSQNNKGESGGGGGGRFTMMGGVLLTPCPLRAD